MGGGALAKNVVGGSVKAVKAFRELPGTATKLYGGMREAGGAIRNAGLKVGAGVTFVSSKIGLGGASMHDKMMTSLHGANYAGSITARREQKQEELDYRLSKGMTKGDIAGEQKHYKKSFDTAKKKEQQQARFEKGGYLGMGKKK